MLVNTVFGCEYCSGKWWAYELLLSLGGEIFAAEVRHCGLVWVESVWFFKKEQRFGFCSVCEDVIVR